MQRSQSSSLALTHSSLNAQPQPSSIDPSQSLSSKSPPASGCGIAGERRILPEGWVAYTTRQTLDAGYGAGFWLNSVSTPLVWGGAWGMPGAPQDAFFARGYLGQFIVIVPSANLVVVRMGVDTTPSGGVDDVGTFVREIIEAIDAPNAAR
jgi:CubicO group peptidase (beta-lactamase class C family)